MSLGQSPREAWERGLDLGGPREHRRIRYDDVFRVLTLPGSPRETALVYRNHGIQFHFPLAQEGILICFSPLFKGKVRDASASAQIEHKGGKWVFSELKNEPVCSHFYCITSCLLAHCPFGRFFLAFFPLYSGGNDATLAHPR